MTDAPGCPHGTKVYATNGEGPYWACPEEGRAVHACPPEWVRAPLPGPRKAPPVRNPPPVNPPVAKVDGKPPTGQKAKRANPGWRPVVDSVESAPDSGTLVKVPRTVWLDYVASCVTNKSHGMTARDLHMAHVLTQGGFDYRSGEQTDYRTASVVAGKAGVSLATAEGFFSRIYKTGGLRKIPGTGKRLPRLSANPTPQPLPGGCPSPHELARLAGAVS